MEPESSLPHPNQRTTWPYSESDKFSPCLPNLLLEDTF